MKSLSLKVIKGVLLVALPIMSYGQKVSKESVKHNYLRSPKIFLSKDKTVKKEVIVTYLEENEDRRQQNEYSNNQRQENAQKEVADYKKQKTSSKVAERMLLGKKKPTGEAKSINLQYLPKEWSEAYVIEKGCKTVGLKTAIGAKARIVVIIEKPKITYQNKDVSADGPSSAYYLNEAKVVGDVKVEVFNEKGEMVDSKTFTNRSSASGKRFSSSSARTAVKKSEERKLKLTAEETCMKYNMSDVQKYVSENLDYTTVEKNSKIYSIVDKKGNYTEINDCLPKFTKGLQYLGTNETYQKGVDLITSLIPIYESASKEYEPNNKKAKINEGVVQALYLNLAQAYIWSNEFEKAATYLAEHAAVNAKNNKKAVEKIKFFLEDQRMRFEASKM